MTTRIHEETGLPAHEYSRKVDRLLAYDDPRFPAAVDRHISRSIAENIRRNGPLVPKPLGFLAWLRSLFATPL